MNNMTEKEIAKLREKLTKKRVTEWMCPSGGCGDTSYDCVTNYGWLKCDLRRLRSHKVNACIVRYKGMVAIFRIDEGETEDKIISKLDACGVIPKLKDESDNI